MFRRIQTEKSQTSGTSYWNTQSSQKVVWLRSEWSLSTFSKLSLFVFFFDLNDPSHVHQTINLCILSYRCYIDLAYQTMSSKSLKCLNRKMKLHSIRTILPLIREKAKNQFWCEETLPILNGRVGNLTWSWSGKKSFSRRGIQQNQKFRKFLQLFLLRKVTFAEILITSSKQTTKTKTGKNGNKTK